MIGINEVARQIHENAVEHGWWDEKRGFPEIIALIHSEVSEALEEYRNGRLPMGKRSRRGKRQKKFLADERFATKVIVAIGITTAIFIAAQYVSFLITGIEQTTLITYYFSAVVIECGALMLKRVSEIIVARVKKKEEIEPETETDESEVL